MNQLFKAAMLVYLIMTIVAGYGQTGEWAAADDANAKSMIDAERQWVEAPCTRSKIAGEILADDFQGTTSRGERYTKSEELARTSDLSRTARDCRLFDAKVRLFGNGLAIAYGSERSVRKAKDGVETPTCFIWTDTWLKRNGVWQVIAAQDTHVDCK